MTYAEAAVDLPSLPAPDTAPRKGPAPATARLLFASLDLPFVFEKGPAGRWRARRGDGALPRAIPRVLSDRRGAWIGWPGVAAEDAPELAAVLAGAIDGAKDGGCWALRPVWLDREEACQGARARAGDLLAPPLDEHGPWCEPTAWTSFRRLGRKFAIAAVSASAGKAGAAGTDAPGDLLWAHGEALAGVGRELRRLAPGLRSALFLPAAFPAPDRFLRLPWRRWLLSSLLAWDQLGFQTGRDLEAFFACVRRLEPTIEIVEIEGIGARWVLRLAHRGPGGETREVRAGAFPMAIDSRDVARRAARPEVAAAAAALRAALGCRFALAVDRLDPAQGTTWKLRAFRELLSRRPELRGALSLLLWVEPEGARPEEAARLRAEIERLVGEINGGLGAPGWVPVHYRFRSPTEQERLAAYRAADLALFTPLSEGLGLAAKELCAAKLDGSGVLVLSEFDGAAAQMAGGAFVVNPHDVAATAAAMRRACGLDPAERAARMRRLRQAVAREDVYRWADSFLAEAQAPAESGRPRERTALVRWS